MRTWKESAIMAAFIVVAVLTIVWRIGYNMGADTATDGPHPSGCDGENLSYRSDKVAVRTYVGDPGNGVLCASVPLELLFTE
jgi:hypothetical protein